MQGLASCSGGINSAACPTMILDIAHYSLVENKGTQCVLCFFPLVRKLTQSTQQIYLHCLKQGWLQYEFFAQ